MVTPVQVIRLQMVDLGIENATSEGVSIIRKLADRALEP